MKKRSTTKVMSISLICLLFISIAGLWILYKPSAATLISISTPSDPTEATTYLVKNIEGLSDNDFRVIARNLAEDKDLNFLRQTSNNLIYMPRIETANRLGSYIAEYGHEHHNDISLTLRAGLEYKLGRFVPRNYGKAIYFLDSLILKDVPIANYYLAEVFLAEDNPNRNLVKGTLLLEKAADAGIEAAQKKMEEL